MGFLTVANDEVGASLGHDSVQAGKMSIIFGSLMVMLFMMLYYKLSGIFAVIVLMLAGVTSKARAKAICDAGSIRSSASSTRA